MIKIDFILKSFQQDMNLLQHFSSMENFKYIKLLNYKCVKCVVKICRHLMMFCVNVKYKDKVNLIN